MLQRPKFLKESRRLKWNFWRGGGRGQSKKKNTHGVGMDIFWNHTMLQISCAIKITLIKYKTTWSLSTDICLHGYPIAANTFVE